MKKLRIMFNSIGVITISYIPIALVISCNKKKIIIDDEIDENEADYKTNAVKPLDFNIFKTIGKNEPIFFGGINYTAYSQGMSFIFNILKGLGWNWEDTDKINKLYDDKFNFDDLNIKTNVNSKYNINQPSSPFEIKFSKEFVNWKNVGNFIEKKTSKKLIKNFKLYNQFITMKNIGNRLSPNKIKNVDALSAIEIDLGSGFRSLDDSKKYERIANKLNDKNNLNKIFKNEKYLYSWNGKILTKLAFQINSNKLIIWHYSSNLHKLILKIDSVRNFNSDLQKFINSNPRDDTKNLSQVYLDPTGADGSISKSAFFTTANFKTTDNKKNFETYLGHKKNHYRNKLWDFSIKSNNKIFIPAYSSFIDGKKPGTVILKMYEGDLLSNKNINEGGLITRYPLKTLTSTNHIQTFYKIKNLEKQKNLITLIYSFLNFLKTKAKKNDYEISGFKQMTSPLIHSMIEFLTNNDFTKDDIKDAFGEINNGSHYMLAVEIFLRGLNNIPKELNSIFNLPIGIKIFETIISIKRKNDELVGMSNVNNLFAILFFMYTSLKEGSIFHSFFNPKTSKWIQNKDKSYKWMNHKGSSYEQKFLRDLSSKKKAGKETKSFPL